jgi:molecular chaperone IbpA
MRTATDFSPLYRSFIGFDHLANLMDKANRTEKQSTYPPYNIELLAEDKYRISMAVAGFTEQELDIQSERNTLVVTGTKTSDDKVERKFIYQGIADRNFERKFQLNDHIKVVGAFMRDGLLHIDLEREIPEALKPRKIAINSTSALNNQLEHDQK